MLFFAERVMKIKDVLLTSPDDHRTVMTIGSAWQARLVPVDWAALCSNSSASNRISVAAAERGSASVTPLPSISAATKAVRFPSEARDRGMPALVI